MFIRKRTRQTRVWGFGISYQVIESYREGGKVKQRVAYNLRHIPTPEAALKIETEAFEETEKKLKAGAYTSNKYRHQVEESHKKRLERIQKLRDVVSRMDSNEVKFDTTPLKRSVKSRDKCTHS